MWAVELTAGKWNDAAEYAVATNTMLAAGGHNYKPPAGGGMRAEHDPRAVREELPVSTPEPGRIAKAKAPKP